MVRKLATNFHNWTMGVYDEQLVGAQNQQLVESGLSYGMNLVSDNRGSLYPRQGTKPLMRLNDKCVLIPYTVGNEACFGIVGHNGIRFVRYDNKTFVDPTGTTSSFLPEEFTSTTQAGYWVSSGSNYGFKCALVNHKGSYSINYVNASYADPFSNRGAYTYYRLFRDSSHDSKWRHYETFGQTSVAYFKNLSTARKANLDLFVIFDSTYPNYVKYWGRVGLSVNSVQGKKADGTWETLQISVETTVDRYGAKYAIKTPDVEYGEYAVSFTVVGNDNGWREQDAFHDIRMTVCLYAHDITEYSGFNTTFLPLSYSGDLTKIQYVQNYEDMYLVGDSDFVPQAITLTQNTLSIADWSPTGLTLTTTGYPSAIDMYQNRVVLSGFVNTGYRNLVAISEFSNATAASTDFTVPQQPTATSALGLYASKLKYKIAGLYGGDKALYVLSGDGVSYIEGVGTSGSPTFKIRNHERAGAVKPIVKDDILIYTDADREKIYMVDYDLLVERFKVFDVSMASKNLMSKKIKEMFYLPNRDRLIYILFDDGTMCAFLFDNNLNMRGFYPLETQGKVYDVCVHPEANELFLVVKRANNYYIEVIEERPFINYDHAGDEQYQKDFLTWMGNNTRFVDFESRDMWRDRVISEDGLFFQYNGESEYLIPSEITETTDNGLVTDSVIDATIDNGLVTDTVISDTVDNGGIGELVTGYSAIVKDCTQTLFDALEIDETYLFFDGQTPDKTKGQELTLLQKVWALDGTTAIFIFDAGVDETFYYPAAIKKITTIAQPQIMYWDGQGATITTEDIMGTTDLAMSYQVVLDGMYIGDYDSSFNVGEPFISHPLYAGYFSRIGLKYEKHGKMSYVAPLGDQKLISELNLYLLNTQDLDVGVNGGFQSITKFCTDGYYDYPNRLYQGEYSMVVDNNTEIRKDVEVKTEQPFGFEILAISAITDYGNLGGN